MLFSGSNEFRVQCKVVAKCPSHYLGKEFEAKNTEHFMEYLINEHVHGNGISEWNYRNTAGIAEEGLPNESSKITNNVLPQPI